MSVDFSQLGPANIVYKNCKGENGLVHDMVLAGDLPLQWVLDNMNRDQAAAIIYSPENIDFLKDCLKIKTKPEIVESCFKNISINQLKKINEDITNVLSFNNDKEPEIVKKKL